MKYACNVQIDLVVIVEAANADEAESGAVKLVEEQVTYGTITEMDYNWPPTVEIGYIENMQEDDDAG